MGSKTPIFSNKAYDTLKWVALVCLPGVGVLYFGLAEIWNLPYAVQVMGTTAALDTFLGTVLGISNHRYKNSDARFDGALVIDTREPGTGTVAFDMKQPITSFEKADQVTLKVETPPAEKSQ
jgi:hypothetical protein